MAVRLDKLRGPAGGPGPAEHSLFLDGATEANVTGAPRAWIRAGDGAAGDRP